MSGYQKAPFDGAIMVDDVRTGDILISPDGKKFKVAVGDTTETTIDIGVCLIGGINELHSWATINKGYYLNGFKPTA